MPPLDRLAVREVSLRYLSQDEQIEIADLRQSGLSIRAIATFVIRVLVPREEKFIEQRSIDRDVWLTAGANGYLGLEDPEQYGGQRSW